MSDSSTPLARYVHRLRRQRIAYFFVVAAVVAALAVLARVAWSRGEIAHTALTTASAPPSLPPATPKPVLRPAWKTSDHAAIGTPQWGGTVVVFGEHAVRGVDARTGRQTWSYTRGNRSVCTAAQLGGTTVAVYALSGNCDELTALDSGTGKRKWTRTLDMDGMPLNGHPAFQTFTQDNSSTLLVRSSTVMYALEASTGVNRWTYTHFGCTITGSAIGADAATGAGHALISQDCSAPRCGKLRFCGPGPQLLLRNLYDARDEKSATNPDMILWNRIGSTDLPVSADELISAVDPRTGTLHQLDSNNGSLSASTTLGAPLSPLAVATARAAQIGDTEVVWVDGATYALRAGVDVQVWKAPTAGPPTLTVAPGDATPTLSSVRITVPSAGGAAALDGSTGRVAHSFSLADPGPGALVYPLGPGFLVNGRDGTAAYS